MNRKLSFYLGLTIIGLMSVGRADEGTAVEPAANVPQLQLLDRLRGEWTGTIGNGDAEMKLSSRWILEGQVLETKIEVGLGMRVLLLRTYDAENEKYVATYMDTEGSVVLMQGAWDENQQTLSTSGQRGAEVITLSTRFVDEQTAQWSITQSRGGAEVSQIGGTNRRVRR